MEPPLLEKPRQIHEAVRQLRLSRGMTQAEVAPALGVSRSTVAQIEGGNRSLKALEVGRLAALYGCSAEERLGPLEKEASALAAREGVLGELLAAVPELREGSEGPGTFRGVLTAARALTKLERALGFQGIVNVLPSYPTEPPDTPWQAAHQGHRASEDERRRLALGEGPIRYVDELLATVGVRAAKARLPRGITSVFLSRPEPSCVVVVSDRMELGSRRFSYAHGLAHALFDREIPWRVCRPENDQDLLEVRANAFASSFLLPEHGVRRYLETLGRETLGRAGPAVLSLFVEGEDEQQRGEALRVDGRVRKGRHPITLPDLTRAAHYYGVGRILTAHRLRNLRLLTEDQRDTLHRLSRDEPVRKTERTLALPRESYETDSLRSRVGTLAAEAYCRHVIDEHEFAELATTIGISEADREQLLAMSEL